MASDLINFTGSMPVPRLRVTPTTLIVGGVLAAALLMAISPMARAAITTASGASTPTPTPTPLGANIVLDVAAGGPSTHINVTGTLFLPNESMSLYWDNNSRVAANVTSDGNGNFTKAVTPFPGDGPGVHHLCASVPPNPCANFTLQGPPTPTPAASPSPSSSATPSESPSPTPSASPVMLTTNSGRSGLDVITRPPFVFLPIIGLLAILAALAYWLLMRVDRTPVLPSASVVHRSARPEIGPPPQRSPAEPPTPEMQPPPEDVPPPEPPSY